MSDPLRHCPECGSPLVTDIKFCGTCGAELRLFRDADAGDAALDPSPAPVKAELPQHKKTMMGLPGMMPPPAAAPAPTPQVSKQTMFGVPSMDLGPTGGTGPAQVQPQVEAPAQPPTRGHLPAPEPSQPQVQNPAPVQYQAAPAAAAAAEAPSEPTTQEPAGPRFQAPPRRRHEVSYSEPPPGPTSEFALPTRGFPLKAVLGIAAAAALVAFALLLVRTLGADPPPAPSSEEDEGPSSVEEAPLVPEPGLVYTTFAADPSAHRGRVVELRGTLYNVTSGPQGRSLQMLVDGCVVGQHCPVWIDFTGEGPAANGDRIRVVARIVGTQQFRVRGTEGEVSTVPKLTARTLTPLTP